MNDTVRVRFSSIHVIHNPIRFCPTFSNNGSTFLDAIYCENLATYFALDALQWDDYDLRRGSAEYRLYHLQDCIADQMTNPELHPKTISRFKRFVTQLPLFPCTPSGVSRALNWSPLPNLNLDLDGILFYHHDAMYSPGSTPLVGWIKPWMASEVFKNVQVPPNLLARKPNIYKDRVTYMKEWNAKEARQQVRMAGCWKREVYTRRWILLVRPKSKIYNLTIKSNVKLRNHFGGAIFSQQFSF